MKLSIIKSVASYFPLAPRRSAILQAIRLIDARKYLQDRGIEATVLGSEFHYERSTGSILQ